MRPKSEKNKLRDWHKSRARIRITYEENPDLWIDRLERRRMYTYLKRAGYKKEWKRISNHSVRKYSKGISNGSDYRKVYELMWRLY